MTAAKDHRPVLPAALWHADPDPGYSDSTIGDALTRAASQWRDRTALVDGVVGEHARRWTFEELLEDSVRVAHALLRWFSPGERLAVWAGNSPEWIQLEFGAALAGLTLVTVNPAFRQAELSYVLEQSRAAGIVVQPRYRSAELLPMANAARDGTQVREVISLDDWDGLRADESSARDGLPHVAPKDPAQIQYTSGTTGRPKGALLSHRGLVANGRRYATVIGAHPDDVWVNPMPLFHTAGCGLVTLGALQTGGCHVIPAGFDADLMLDLFEAERGTLMLSVPTMLIRMLERQADRPRDVSSWRLTTLGGAPVPIDLVLRAQRDLGVGVGIGYGQTEASPYITHTAGGEQDTETLATVGRPLPGTEVKIIAPGSGEVAGVGELGEICTRSVCVMTEYFDDAAATAEAIDADGWLHTGDLGTMDASGSVAVEGRLKDMIIRGGENIFPREIEDVLYTHPGISLVTVIGLPDAEWGETVAAFVVAADGPRLTGDELDAFCRDRLASYKVPRSWHFRSELPQTASGKIQKVALREEHLVGGSRSPSA
ncbi:AMP-binding protein [Actinomadura sp. 7K507]|uniref:class I adenylate-forming enzyme family protein n=1 Tax=Actinomadura sp. 7K507 TaxID=2530365 RepID=UPI00104E12A8|nr:AMP-binding protein [Actinomadura sp. 7K507]TDC93070.1 AMP-dependent synthetase [Actinomadura sp. 7K507]